MIRNLLVVLILIISVSISAQNYKCHQCKQPIEGKYIIVEDLIFHPNHFICAYCGKAIESSYQVHKEEFLHESCFIDLTVEKCQLCGEPLIGTFLIDIYNVKVHKHHENEIHRCNNCNRIISKNMTNGGVRHGDGRTLCNLCYENSFKGDYDDLLKKVLIKLGYCGYRVDEKNISVVAVDNIQLKKYAKGNYVPEMRGYCNTEVQTTQRGNKITEKSSHTIYVLESIPAEYIESTMAHELMHVWIHQNKITNLEPQLEEGSCNFISFTYLKDDNRKYVADIIKQMETDPNLVYGDGFRRIQEKFKGRELKELFSYLKTNKK